MNVVYKWYQNKRIDAFVDESENEHDTIFVSFSDSWNGQFYMNRQKFLELPEPPYSPEQIDQAKILSIYEICDLIKKQK